MQPSGAKAAQPQHSQRKKDKQRKKQIKPKKKKKKKRNELNRKTKISIRIAPNHSLTDRHCAFHHMSTLIDTTLRLVCLSVCLSAVSLSSSSSVSCEWETKGRITYYGVWALMQIAAWHNIMPFSFHIMLFLPVLQTSIHENRENL